MTQDEIIRMAEKACSPNQILNTDPEFLERFAALVAAHEREKCFDAAMKAAEKAVDAAMLLEREACAKVCEETDLDWRGLGSRIDCAAAIRARGD